jgi:hypothetical protein
MNRPDSCHLCDLWLLFSSLRPDVSHCSAAVGQEERCETSSIFLRGLRELRGKKRRRTMLSHREHQEHGEGCRNNEFTRMARM